MGWGVLEPNHPGHVPGTTRYYDDPNQPGHVHETKSTLGLKTVEVNGKHVILVPQPSDDPNDPLNWPLWQRDMITFVLSISAILGTAQGSILAADTITIAIDLRHNFTDVALLTGYFLMGCGAAAVFFVPSGRVWGKRHAFIIGLVILVASSAWATFAHKNYNSLLGARIVQGVGCAPFESLINAAVGDLYCVHERGVRMAFVNMAVLGGAFFAPIIAGKMAMTMGWEWSFGFTAIFCGAALVAVFFFCPEMSYRRNAELDLDRIGGDMPASEETESKAPALTQESRSPSDTGLSSKQLSRAAEENIAAPSNVILRKKSWVQSLALFDGRKTDESFFVLLLRPFPLFIQPAFFWACLVQGTMIGWTVFTGAIIAELFQGPPYFWREDKTGYTYVSPVIGAIVGFTVSGALSDWSARFMTKRNNNIYEPEFRILLVIPMFVLGEIGLYGFGISAANIAGGKTAWQVPVVFFGLIVCAMVIGAVASSLYVVDAYRGIAIEGFTIMMVFKNFFSFFLTWYAFEWVTSSIGTRKIFIVLASIQIFVCLLSIPIYIYGKRIRSLFYRRNMLKKLGLD
ncbi:hypothetical protein TD95_004711 [Thielaviopsis punctulata]|uniref:Major facilitator superfamily (MFS) profile domain-containing protein n=1 Tax=Thielaviopsis punctulata TaxID=72032 RepID=A0A0F4ZFU8_9PEZI|nr:hypothetical protein TD95_004711 [Thielaviopsis punctulata]